MHHHYQFADFAQMSTFLSMLLFLAPHTGGHGVLRFGRRNGGPSDLLSAADGVYEIDHRLSHLRLDANAFR